MPKNIEMNILGDNGQYETLYPYTIPEQVQDLLNNDTKLLIGLTEESTPDDAFREIYFISALGDKCSFTLTVKTNENQVPLKNIPVNCDSFIDINNNPIEGPLYTNQYGQINTFFKSGNVTLSINGFADLEDWSQSFNVVNGQQYQETANLITINFQKYTSSTSIMLSSNVSQLDVTCVGGGGGGGGGGEYIMGGGGGGGYCAVQENISFNENYSYNIIVGAGGTSGGRSDGSATSSKPTSGISIDGGNGGTTSFINVSALGGNGGGVGWMNYSYINNGGIGGIGNGNGGNGGKIEIGSYSYTSPTNGTNGSVQGYSSFTETILYGGGGGGGASCMADYVTRQGSPGGTYGGSGGSAKSAGNKGDTNYYANNGEDGQNGFGGGGGSGSVATWTNNNQSRQTAFSYSGSGGSGCVAIRMHLNAT